MHDEKLTVVKLWFKKADSDLKNIENNLKSDDPPTLEEAKSAFEVALKVKDIVLSKIKI